MKSLRIFDRRIGTVGASFTLLLGILVPSIIPMAASAATLSTRSIQMSSSATSTTGNIYTVNFTTTAAAKGFVIDFCNETPFSGDACTAPSGMSTASATVAFTAGSIGTVTPSGSGGHIAIQGSTAQTAGATTFTITGITNPSATGVIYARIYTYTGTIDYTNVTTPGTVADFGGVALDITSAIGVTAAVREKLIFCVSAAVPTASCGGITPPSLTLGEGVPQALDSGHTSTGDDYSQISTNASGGAVVNMTNGNQCGGLHRAGAGATVCDIAPVGTSAADIVPGTAKFGVKLGTVSTLSGGSGTIGKNANYDTNYGMGYVAGNATGVSSTFGTELYNTSGAPANNVNVPMTFGASISNDTPAGIYSATINLIATGTY